MQTDDDLPTLIRRKDHYHVLCYLRIHQIREPDLVLTHAFALLGQDLSRRARITELARLAILEQVCLAALERNEHKDATAKLCLQRLKEAGVLSDSLRFRRLLARTLEAAEDYVGAEIIYDEILRDNPANLMALKRKYCLLKAQHNKQPEANEALNLYLEQNYSDTAAWYEMAKNRMEMGDYKSAAFCLEETLLGVPADAFLHCQLAEVYSSIGGLDHLMLARKHIAQALELDPDCRRAQFGLVAIANAYLLEEEAATKKVKKDLDAHQVAVAKALVLYGAEAINQAYKGTELHSTTKSLMNEYVDNL